MRAERDTMVEKSISNARAGRDASMDKDIRRMPVSKYKTCPRRYLRVGSSSSSLASSRRRRKSVAFAPVEPSPTSSRLLTAEAYLK